MDTRSDVLGDGRARDRTHEFTGEDEVCTELGSALRLRLQPCLLGTELVVPSLHRIAMLLGFLQRCGSYSSGGVDLHLGCLRILSGVRCFNRGCVDFFLLLRDLRLKLGKRECLSSDLRLHLGEVIDHIGLVLRPCVERLHAFGEILRRRGAQQHAQLRERPTSVHLIDELCHESLFALEFRLRLGELLPGGLGACLCSAKCCCSRKVRFMRAVVSGLRRVVHSRRLVELGLRLPIGGHRLRYRGVRIVEVFTSLLDLTVEVGGNHCGCRRDEREHE